MNDKKGKERITLSFGYMMIDVVHLKNACRCLIGTCLSSICFLLSEYGITCLAACFIFEFLLKFLTDFFLYASLLTYYCNQRTSSSLFTFLVWFCKPFFPFILYWFRTTLEIWCCCLCCICSWFRARKDCRFRFIMVEGM